MDRAIAYFDTVTQARKFSETLSGFQLPLSRAHNFKRCSFSLRIIANICYAQILIKNFSSEKLRGVWLVFGVGGGLIPFFRETNPCTLPGGIPMDFRNQIVEKKLGRINKFEWMCQEDVVLNFIYCFCLLQPCLLASLFLFFL